MYHRWISIVRVLATLLVILCHIGTSIQNPMLAQVALVGVELFLLISGFLCGEKDIRRISLWQYLKNKISRLYVPVMIHVFFVGIIFIVIGKKIQFFHFLFSMIGLNGISRMFPFVSIPVVDGISHFWFLFVLMICYLLVWIVQKKGWEISLSKESIMVFFGIQILLGLISVRISYIIVFFIGYAFANTRWNPTFLKATLINGSCILGLLIRLLMRRYMDDTVFYLYVIIPFVSNIFAFAIFFDIRILGEYKKHIKQEKRDVLKSLDGMTYYLYIVHYIFLDGALNVFFLKLFFLYRIVIFLCLTIVFAYILRRAEAWIKKIIESR